MRAAMLPGGKSARRRGVRRPNTCVWVSICGLVLLLAGIRYLPSGGSASTVGLSSAGGPTRYVVVFDAGSTGSRVHVYSFKVSSSSQLQLLKDDFNQLKPGLSAYAGKPSEAAASLDPLLDKAKKAVPVGQHASTRCILRATAGLRLLHGRESLDILSSVLEHLKQSPFKVDDDSVSILGGQDEGAFAWLTLNYLLGKLGKQPEKTAIAVDLGGGSVQASYAVGEDEAKCGPKGYIKELKGGGMTYNVYVHSYLNFGLMAARAEILKAGGEGKNCIPNGFSSFYPYGGKDYAVNGSAGDSGGKECRETVETVLKVRSPCEAPKDQCSFQGAWAGPGMKENQEVYLFSYFWDRALDSRMISKQTAIDAKLTLQEYITSSNEVCDLSLEGVKSAYPHVDEKDLPYLCMDLSYCSTLLKDGFGFSTDLVGNLVKQVKYGGELFEMAWTLGAAVDSLG